MLDLHLDQPTQRPDARSSLDLRFSTLLDAASWSRLPHAIRSRFAKRLFPGASVTYAGHVLECQRTRFGMFLAHAARLIGAPLPLYEDYGTPATVTVTEDSATGGQFWTRIYGRRRGFPQVIHSSKRFAGPTGLEEYLGRGFGIALTVHADAQALHFRSDHYFLHLGRRRVRLPCWLAPGALSISHIERPDGWFEFTLTLRHRLFGEIIRQTAEFRERTIPNFQEITP